MALADTFVRQVKISGSRVGDKHSDGGGLYLHITASGKHGRMNYRYLGKRPIAEITARKLLDVLQVVEKRGIHETAHTLRQNAGQVFRYGLQTNC